MRVNFDTVVRTHAIIITMYTPDNNSDKFKLFDSIDTILINGHSRKSLVINVIIKCSEKTRLNMMI